MSDTLVYWDLIISSQESFVRILSSYRKFVCGTISLVMKYIRSSNNRFLNAGGKYRKLSTLESSSISVYPVADLMRARAEFIHQWNVSMSNHSVAKSIKSDHYKYPPNITMRNYLEYPFHDNSPEVFPFLRTTKNINTTQVVKSKVVEQSLERHKVEIKVDNISDKEFRRVCMLLTDKACLFEDSVQLANQYQCISACYFICDYCDYIGKTENDAQIHLQQTNHLTCSKYSPCYYTNDCNDMSSELQKPRVISNNSDRIYGWHVGDTVVCCPTCNLPFLDKIMCAYHHCLQHTENQSLFTYGKVLIDCIDALCVLSVSCSICQRSFTAVPSLEIEADHPGQKRKHPSNRENTYRSPASWAKDFGHFCIRHAFEHINQGRFPLCSLKIRIISVPKSVKCLPLITGTNNSSRLHFNLSECKRLISYLENHELNSYLLKQAQKSFRDLFFDAVSYVS
ncbi:unnamed protein product [Schistosoma mattheei]|uniref:Uncharacterized protein n=1 Tax=Schistosoma mattheei TaxID=31246 RepID=A0AA85B5K0_9TREM|nr:unnamed protein product [Schistosoma mattheei]